MDFLLVVAAEQEKERRRREVNKQIKGRWRQDGVKRCKENTMKGKHKRFSEVIIIRRA